MDLLELLDILDLDLSLHLDLYLLPGPGLGPGPRSGHGVVSSNYQVSASVFRSISQLLPSSPKTNTSHDLVAIPSEYLQLPPGFGPPGPSKYRVVIALIWRRTPRTLMIVPLLTYRTPLF